jgi:hypothetical protein
MHFLNFLQLSEIINKNKKNCRTVLGQHFSPRPSTVGLACNPFWPTGALGQCSAVARSPRAARSSAARRNRPATRSCPWRFNGGEGVPVAGEGGDGVLQLEEETGDEGRSTVKGDNGQGSELTEGGSRRRRLHFRWRQRAPNGRPWAGGRGGGRSGACGMLAKEEERGKRKGWAAFVMPLIGVAGGRGRRGGVRGSVHVKERDKRREVGLARRSVAGTGPWPTGTGRRRTRAWHGAE